MNVRSIGRTASNDDAIKGIIRQAANQPKPLKHGSKEGKKELDEFLHLTSKIWDIADMHQLRNPITQTNFVLIGPQSAGKTSLVERILKFPIAAVKSKKATTRPMVLTTRRGDKGSVVKVLVKDGDGQAEKKDDKTEVMEWVADRMPEHISSEKLYVQVTGPDYMDRRFVDLPGFQLNDDGTGTSGEIEQLLEKEMEENPNTVVVCVEEARKEYVSSPLIKAIEKAFKGNFFSRQLDFVVALNKSDEWLGKHGTATASVFPTHLYAYVENFRSVPILVGGTVDPENKELRNRRDDGTASCVEIEKEYAGANKRENEVYETFFQIQKVDAQLSGCLRENFMGFEKFLGTIDSLVIHRGLKNVPQITKQLQAIVDEKNQLINSLKKQQEVLNQIEDNVLLFIGKLLDTMDGIMGTNHANDALGVLGNRKYQKQYGMKAFEEEEQFFKEYYRKSHHYELYSDKHLHLGCNDKFDQPNEDSIDRWYEQAEKTMNDLRDPNFSIEGIALNEKLVGGALYKRAFGVWASIVYASLLPTEEDLEILPSLAGMNAETPNQDTRVLQMKRLAEGYIKRLIPGVEYVCQKMEFLLLKIFDTAWLSLLEKPKYRDIVSAVGSNSFGVSFKTSVKKIFREALEGSARLAYNQAFFDLDNEIYKLQPILPGRAAMKSPFPGNVSVEEVQHEYRRRISKVAKSDYEAQVNQLFPKGIILEALKNGIIGGIEILAEVGIINPLFFLGLHVLKSTVILISDAWKSRKRDKASPQDIQELQKLGEAVCMYTHFVPSFISSVDARMRAVLWESLKNVPLNKWIEKQVQDSEMVQEKKNKRESNKAKITSLETERKEVESRKEELESFSSQATEATTDEPLSVEPPPPHSSWD